MTSTRSPYASIATPVDRRGRASIAIVADDRGPCRAAPPPCAARGWRADTRTLLRTCPLARASLAGLGRDSLSPYAAGGRRQWRRSACAAPRASWSGNARPDAASRAVGIPHGGLRLTWPSHQSRAGDRPVDGMVLQSGCREARGAPPRDRRHFIAAPARRGAFRAACQAFPSGLRRGTVIEPARVSRAALLRLRRRAPPRAARRPTRHGLRNAQRHAQVRDPEEGVSAAGSTATPPPSSTMFRLAPGPVPVTLSVPIRLKKKPC